MSHGSETRRMRGGKIGVGGRRSRDGAGLGSSLRLTGEEGEKRASKLWNTYKKVGREVSHDWFGGSKKPSPVYVMPKTKPYRNPAPSLINKSGDKYTTFENRQSSSMMDGRHGESLMLPLVQRGR